MNLHSIPKVDHCDGGGDEGDLFFLKVCLKLGAFGGVVGFGIDGGEGLGPGEDGLFGRGEVVDLSPDNDAIEAFGRFSLLSGVTQMHVQTERASVDLGGADFDEFDEGWGKVTRANGSLGFDEGLKNFGDLSLIVEWFHVVVAGTTIGKLRL